MKCLYLICVVLLLAIIGGCSGEDNSIAPENISPTITDNLQSSFHFKGFEFDVSDADKVLFIKNTEKQYSWETTDPNAIAKIADLFSGISYGEPHPGGYAGEFLFLKFFSSGKEIGSIHLVTENEIMLFNDGFIYTVTILQNGWNQFQWESFLNTCNKTE